MYREGPSADNLTSRGLMNSVGEYARLRSSNPPARALLDIISKNIRVFIVFFWKLYYTLIYERKSMSSQFLESIVFNQVKN